MAIVKKIHQAPKEKQTFIPAIKIISIRRIDK